MLNAAIPSKKSQRSTLRQRQMLKAISTARRNVCGERSLIAAVIAVSVVDLVQGNEREQKDAAAYFAGPVYQDHLQWLGLPGDYLPELINDQKP